MLKRLPEQMPSGPDGEPPVPDPEFGPALATAWYARYLAEGNDTRPMAVEGLPYRASWALARCNRALWFRMSGQSPSDPPGLADAWRFGLGSMVHDHLQRVLLEAFPGCEVEAPVDLRPDLDGSCTADVVTHDPDGAVDAVVEVKTINGWGFKMQATHTRGLPTGPKHGHKVQAALAGMRLGAKRIVIVYLSLENLSPSEAKRAGLAGEWGRFCAEWHYPRSEFLRWAYDEVARVTDTYEGDVLHGHPSSPALSDPEYPEHAVVTDPGTGAWVVRGPDGTITDAGTTWMCNYCDFRSACRKMK